MKKLLTLLFIFSIGANGFSSDKKESFAEFSKQYDKQKTEDDMTSSANTYVEDRKDIEALVNICDKYYGIQKYSLDNPVVLSFNLINGKLNIYQSSYKEYIKGDKKGIVNQFLNAIVYISTAKNRDEKRQYINAIFGDGENDLSSLFNIDANTFISRFNDERKKL